MLKKLRFSTIIFSSFCLSFLISVSAHSQNNDNTTANNECSKVLQKAAKKEGKEYANKACDSNVYPADFWRCVDKEMDSFDLNMSIYFCEKSYGFK